MASLPLSAARRPDQTGVRNPVRTGLQNSRNKGVNVMGIAILLFFVALAVASGVGLTYDSRDSGDWQPSRDGRSYRW
jgi:hypothetical protein